MSESSPKARALRGGGADRKLLTPAKMLVPSRSKSSSADSAQAEIIRNIRAEGSKIRSTMVAELRSASSSATEPSTSSRGSRSRSASEDRGSSTRAKTSSASAASSSLPAAAPEGKKRRGRPPKSDVQEQASVHYDHHLTVAAMCFLTLPGTVCILTKYLLQPNDCKIVLICTLSPTELSCCRVQNIWHGNNQLLAKLLPSAGRISFWCLLLQKRPFRLSMT